MSRIQVLCQMCDLQVFSLSLEISFYFNSLKLNTSGRMGRPFCQGVPVCSLPCPQSLIQYLAQNRFSVPI